MAENRFFATAGRGLGGNDRFRLWRPTFYRALGVELEKGKQYEIHGTVDDGLEFTVHHVKSTRPYIYLTLPKKDANTVELGRVHSISIDSVKERTGYNVFGNTDGPAVKISRLLMSLKGFGPERYPVGHVLMLELGWRNLTRSSDPLLRTFLSYNVDSAVIIRMKKFGAQSGDLLRLEYVKLYEPSDFAKDFASRKAEIFSNVALEDQERGLSLRVDGETFDLQSPHLRFHGIWVILGAIVAPSMKEVKFWFGPNGKTGIHFFHDKRVTNMRAGPGDLEISYHSGTNKDRTFSVYRDGLDKSRLLSEIRLTAFPEIGVGRFLGEISPNAAQYIRSRLASSAHTSRWAREKGDISEEIQAHLLQASVKWDEVARHPFGAESKKTYDSCKVGPDSLMRLKESGELCYFEFKWWEHYPGRALSDARQQAAANLRDYPSYQGQPVSKTFAAILDWDTRETRLEMFTDCVATERVSENLQLQSPDYRSFDGMKSHERDLIP